MISQADIIRALVNKNCTDESIMAMALSPDCTAPKLLEKFTEAERFDLALDFSMKLGLDVLPLWKTWAMRCLKNRNFQGAREKFKHCFQRLKSSGGRSSPGFSSLLCDILNKLTLMEENKLPLSDEIEIIKNNKKYYHAPNVQHGLLKSDNQFNPSEPKPNMIQTKPKIFSECMQYLKDYGTIYDHIRFFTRNKLWDQAVKLLVDNRARINADKFFIVEVILYSSTIGQLDEVISAFIKLDPNISLSFKYYKAMYNYYTIHRRYNTLYYLQNKLGDYVAAAENQIVNFFLKKPTISYKELDQRLSRLINASDDYKRYIAQLSSEKDSIISAECCSILFTKISIDEAEKRLKTIDNQIGITRNFAINEVQGCINNIEVVCNVDDKDDGNSDPLNDSPVTLFDSSEKRITFLTALVLIYFDVDCTVYFSASGLNLANKLIQNYKLDKVKVFKTAMRIIIEDESCDIIESANLLLKRMTEDHIATSRRAKKVSPLKPGRKSSKHVVIRDIVQLVDNNLISTHIDSRPSTQLVTDKTDNDQQESSSKASTIFPKNKNVKPGTVESARILCDDVVRDSIGSCHEPDYKMKLANLLSPEAKIELYVELGKLSNAQRLAFDMNRPDFVAIILKEAEKLSQDHVKDVCQHWLAKH